MRLLSNTAVVDSDFEIEKVLRYVNRFLCLDCLKVTHMSALHSGILMRAASDALEYFSR